MKKKDHSAELIGQPIPDVVETGALPTIEEMCGRIDFGPQPDENGWFPIATAPKNTPVLVFCPTPDGYIEVATFSTYAYKDGGWWGWDHEYEAKEIDPAPTHWMPMPDHPVGSHGTQPLSETSGSAPSAAPEKNDQ
jgi:hypothetical protein